MGYLKNTMANSSSWTYIGNHLALKEGFQKLPQDTSAYNSLTWTYSQGHS